MGIYTKEVEFIIGHFPVVVLFSAGKDLCITLMHSVQIIYSILQVSEDGNMSTSILSFAPTRQDNGKTLTCRASNHLVQNGVEETSIKLNVFCKLPFNFKTKKPLKSFKLVQIKEFFSFLHLLHLSEEKGIE